MRAPPSASQNIECLVWIGLQALRMERDGTTWLPIDKGNLDFVRSVDLAE